MQLNPVQYGNNIEYIYLIREREFVCQNLNVYKIGRTRNCFTRMNSYPVGSEVYLLHPVQNCVDIETELINIFAERYKRATVPGIDKTIGNEYFVGNVNEMIYIITTYIRYQTNKFVGLK